jgi:hypothetical protein
MSGWGENRDSLRRPLQWVGGFASPERRGPKSLRYRGTKAGLMHPTFEQGGHPLENKTDAVEAKMVR